jgi:hypothetical protein
MASPATVLRPCAIAVNIFSGARTLPPGQEVLLTMIPNGVTRTLTDPRLVYVLRWIAGRHAGVADFDPPCILQ